MKARKSKPRHGDAFGCFAPMAAALVVVALVLSRHNNHSPDITKGR